MLEPLISNALTPSKSAPLNDALATVTLLNNALSAADKDCEKLES